MLLIKAFAVTSARTIMRFPELKEENNKFNFSFKWFNNQTFRVVVFLYFFSPQNCLTDCLHLFIGELNSGLWVTFNMGNAKFGKVIGIISFKLIYKDLIDPFEANRTFAFLPERACEGLL